MGVLDKIRDAVHWLVEKILRPVINWITESINWIIDELRYWKHKGFELLAKWLENDWFFLGAVIATVVLAVTFPKILAWLKNTSLWQWLQSLWEGIKKTTASILDFIHILDLELINNILKVFWPEWRAMMGQLAEVTSALFEELGQGASYGHAYFSVVHSMAMLQHSFTGAPMELAEAQAFEETSNYLTTVNNRFRRYSHNPGLFVRDIIQEIYIPYSETIQDAQQAELDEIRANRDRIVGINTSLKSLDSALTHFMDVQPEEMASFVSERLEPIIEGLTLVTETMDRDILPKINAVVTALEQRTEDQHKINTRLISAMEDPYSLLAQYERYGFEDRQEFERYIAEIVGYGQEQTDLEPLITVLPELDRHSVGLDEHLSAFETVKVEIYESGGFPAVPQTAVVDKTDWFVGEY